MSKPEFIKLKKPAKNKAAAGRSPRPESAPETPVHVRLHNGRPGSGAGVCRREEPLRPYSEHSHARAREGQPTGTFKYNGGRGFKKAHACEEAPRKRARVEEAEKGSNCCKDVCEHSADYTGAPARGDGGGRPVGGGEHLESDKMPPKQHGGARDAKPGKGRQKETGKPKKDVRRSEPKVEYVLDDATAEERALVLSGTISDRIDCLTLLCARNPSSDNYKQLLYFAENQRNDVIYHVLKNLRDLLKESTAEEPYIRSRIIKSYERGVRNPYIKNKVLDIVTVLTRAGIYSEDFLSIIVERLMEKGETLTIVENSIRSLFLKYEEIIMSNIEDFYYKNDTFRVQYLILRFLSTIGFVVSTDVFDFYNQALTTLDSEYSEDHRALMLDLIISGLSKSVSSDSVIERVDLIRGYQSTPQVAISALRLLVKIKDRYAESFVLRLARSLILRKTKQECEFLNIVSTLEGTELAIKLVNSCFYYPAEFIISVIMVANEKEVDPSRLYSLAILARHYHPAVRDVAVRTLRGERVSPYDPYDSVAFEGAASRLY